MGINSNYATINQWLITSHWCDKSLIQYRCYINYPGCLSISFTFSKNNLNQSEPITIISQSQSGQCPGCLATGTSPPQMSLLLQRLLLSGSVANSDWFLRSSIFHSITSTWFSLPLDFHFHAVFTSFQEIRVITDKIAEDADSGDIEADWRFFLEYIKNWNTLGWIFSNYIIKSS